MFVIPLILVLILILSLSANAAEPRMSEIIPTLSFDGTTANCSVAITSPGKDIEATITLWPGNGVIGSWPESGSTAVFISGSTEVTKGEEYVLRATDH